MAEEIGNLVGSIAGGLCALDVLVEGADAAGVAGAGNVLAVGEGLARVHGQDLVVNLAQGVVALGGAVAVACIIECQ